MRRCCLCPCPKGSQGWVVRLKTPRPARDGYLRAFRGNPRIFGISVWGLAPQHVRNDPFFSPFNVKTADWLLDYDFIGKTNNGSANPTEEVICAWFKRNPAPGSPCYGAVAQ